MNTSDAARRIYEFLSESGPKTIEELGNWAADLGLTKARNPGNYVKDKIRYDRRFVCGDDDCWTTVARVLDGRWFTHRVRHDEVAAEALSDELDLGPVYRAVGAEPTYSYAWQRRDEVVALRSTLSGPFHWLPELAPGDLVGLRFDHGRLDVQRIGEATRTLDGARLAQLLRQSVRRPSEFDGRLSTHSVTEQVINALAADADLLREPTLPLSELVPELDRPAGSDLIGSGSGCDFAYDTGDGCWRCRREATSVIRLEVPSRVLDDAQRAASLQDSSLADLVMDEVNGLLAALTGASIDNDDIRRQTPRSLPRGWE